MAGMDDPWYKLICQVASLANRSVIIQLTNRTSCILAKLKVYTRNGSYYVPQQPTVENGVTEVCAFGEAFGFTRGAAGVLTYDITEDLEKEAVKRLAIMFSVPFDYSRFENKFALGLFDTTQSCDKSLFDRMFYRNEQNFQRHSSPGSEISIKEGKYQLRGTMSPAAKAEIKVELYDAY